MSALPDPGRTRRLQHQFTAHLRDPKKNPVPAGIEDRRMEIYRDLVFSNVENFLASNFPVIHTLYSEREWLTLTRDFLREHEAHTPLFPEFGREFLRYVERRPALGHDDPPFLLELAHYEWAELALSLDENEIADVPHDPDGDVLEEIPVVSPLACVLAYRFPVQRIGPDFRPMAPDAEPTVLLLVRDRADEVRFHEINALTALLIEQLQENDALSGAACVERLLGQFAPDAAADLRIAGRQTLRDLRAHDALLGTRGAPTA